ncbi:MAG: small GTP-binding protein domain-containing protein [Candidatus Kentron sp. G]|nr:MAG: small GTP-binding protein domain-containing protein [Candidatus Kentron sp. G]VFN02140.1 MAG: small GTP-binding protein domain-containing protein [Candidatus Kentron sp. G]VFN03373.1 MAG: small GTP-binding protein domain-containing protein [Candidatus Kentron sp. G]
MKCQQSLVDWIRHELERLAQAPDARDYLITPFPAFLSPGNFLARLQQLPSFEYWADWLQGRYLGRPLDPDVLEKSVNLPEEIKKQSPQAINRYLAELAGGGKQEKIKRVRAIFIGNGEAGKTSLIAALNGREVRPGSEDMTCGIEISEWRVKGTELTAHFWDFGGQVIAHATHQFFLRERCVYILVLNARSTDSNPNQQAEYWLEFVRAFGNDAPVLLVGNKCDLTPVQVDLNRLRESYPNIRGFHGLSAVQYRGKYARQFGIFRDAFTEELTKAGEAARLYFSREEFALIESLREQSRQAAFLEKTAFEAECERRGITDREKRQDLLGLLDQLGEVIHFPALYRVHGFRELLLNPRWLTHGVYRLLYSALLKNQHGVLRRTDVVELLKGRSVEDEHGNLLDYPEERLDFLIRAMAEFKLCYPAPDAPHDQWIVPDLLPSDQPEKLDFDGSSPATNAPFNNRQQPGIHGDDHPRTLPRPAPLRFDFRFESFLPRHVLSMFIVEHYRDIDNNLAWQHGVCLKSRNWNNTRALVRADYQSRVLRLAVAGEHVDGYFPVLYHSILKILERMPRLKHTKRLHLDETARIGGEQAFPGEEASEDFDTLLAQKADGQRIVVCKFGKYDLQRLLHLMPEGMEKAGVERTAAGAIQEPQPTLESQPTPAPERQPAASLWWGKAVPAIGLLGSLNVIIGGGGITGWFQKLSPSNEPSPFMDSLEVPLVVAGAVMIAGALIGWWWRRRKGSGNP